MFHNPGKKLKGIAVAWFIFGVLISIAVGVLIITRAHHTIEMMEALAADNPVAEDVSTYAGAGGVVLGVFVILFGFLTSWFSSIGIYALGDMVTDAHYIRGRMDKGIDLNVSARTAKNRISIESMDCPYCGRRVRKNANFCSNCGGKIFAIKDGKNSEN